MTKIDIFFKLSNKIKPENEISAKFVAESAIFSPKHIGLSENTFSAIQGYIRLLKNSHSSLFYYYFYSIRRVYFCIKFIEMNRLIKLRLSAQLSKLRLTTGAQQTVSTCSGVMFEQKGPRDAGSANKQRLNRTPTKKHKPNKNLSHTIQFTSLILPLNPVYIIINGTNSLCFRYLVSYEAKRC